MTQSYKLDCLLKAPTLFQPLDKTERKESTRTVDCAGDRELKTCSENRKMAGPRPSTQADPEIELFVKVSFLALIGASAHWHWASASKKKSKFGLEIGNNFIMIFLFWVLERCLGVWMLLDILSGKGKDIWWMNTRLDGSQSNKIVFLVASYVTLGKSLPPSGPLFLHLYSKGAWQNDL